VILAPPAVQGVIPQLAVGARKKPRPARIHPSATGTGARNLYVTRHRTDHASSRVPYSCVPARDR
jgi:hypothetical protein